MKLPGILSNVLPKKPETVVEVYLTCIFHTDSVEVCAWDIEDKNQPEVISSVTRQIKLNTWELRKTACLDALGELRAKTEDIPITKVVLGLPSAYLTKDGDIEPTIRKELGKILKDLSLTPLGFVPVHQAIIYSLKQEEGIPPNVILLDVEKETAHLYLYKVGQLSGEKIIDITQNIVLAVENGLTGFADIEVLPSRILLFGSDKTMLESSQTELLKHPWQSRANFLHFPKIDIYPTDSVLQSVSLAGASELNLLHADEKPAEQTTKVSPEIGDKRPATQIIDQKSDSTPPAIVTDEITEESNVEVVTPGELGFAMNEDILVRPEEKTREMASDEFDTRQSNTAERIQVKKRSFSNIMPRIRGFSIPKFNALSVLIPNIMLSKAGIIAPVSLVLLAVFLGLLYWFVPHATITVYVVPQTISENQAITIDPNATSINTESKIIPGKQQEKSLSSEKTIPVTGRKKVGDPARGTVTVYNKSTLFRTIKKGTILSSGVLQFTVDNDVQVASASENLANSRLTYGKVNTTISAVSIGPESNLPVNKEFIFKDLSSGVAVARNDQPLTGGTSREASVVTRADQEALVQLLSEELTEKAKSELAGALSLGDTLIAETVKTTIAQKKFSQELNEEAQELNGSLTVQATGISYVTGDVISFLKDLVNAKVSAGYMIRDEETKADVGEVKITKDGKITSQASILSVATPQINTTAIQAAAKGKSLTQLQEVLKQTAGVGSMGLMLRYSPFKEMLPVNQSNISVSIDIHK